MSMTTTISELPNVVTNFGKIRGQRIMTFRKELGSSVRYERFLRWKIARKGWDTRKRKNQPNLL